MCDRVSTLLLLPTKKKINKIYSNMQNFQPTVKIRKKSTASTPIIAAEKVANKVECSALKLTQKHHFVIS